MYLLFCMCYSNAVTFIEFLMDFCTYTDISDTIQIMGKKLLHFKLSKSGQIICVDKTGCPRPSHIFSKRCEVVNFVSIMNFYPN